MSESEQELMARFEGLLAVPKNGALLRELNIVYAPIRDRSWTAYTAKPDLISATIRSWPGAVSVAKLTNTLTVARNADILSLMPRRGHTTEDRMNHGSRRDRWQVRSALRDLAECNLIEYDSPHAKLQFDTERGFMDVTAYEGKLTDYKKAFLQAVMYRGFADSVCVVMPLKGSFKASRAMQDQFRILGIGLWGIRDFNEPASDFRDGFTPHYIYQALRSRKQSPLSRADRIVAIARILRRWKLLQPATLEAARANLMS